MSDEIHGWLIQVTSGDPREGEQPVEMYAVWEPSEDAAVSILQQGFTFGPDPIVATVDTLSLEMLEEQGLQPGQACIYREMAAS